MSKTARFLTQREADRCENAIEPVCHCRCGGLAHGKGRVPVGGDFGTLGVDDPHYVPPTKLSLRTKLRWIETYLLDGYNDVDWPGRIRAANLIAERRRLL